MTPQAPTLVLLRGQGGAETSNLRSPGCLSGMASPSLEITEGPRCTSSGVVKGLTVNHTDTLIKRESQGSLKLCQEQVTAASCVLYTHSGQRAALTWVILCWPIHGAPVTSSYRVLTGQAAWHCLEAGAGSQWVSGPRGFPHAALRAAEFQGGLWRVRNPASSFYGILQAKSSPDPREGGIDPTSQWRRGSGTGRRAGEPNGEESWAILATSPASGLTLCSSHVNCAL